MESEKLFGFSFYNHVCSPFSINYCFQTFLKKNIKRLKAVRVGLFFCVIGYVNI